MANLPTGIPRLDALVRAEAGQQTAGLLYHLERGIKARIDSATSDAQRVYWQSALDDIPPAVAVIDAFETLLRDLTRRESRDWAATTLAGVVGVEVGDTAPRWIYTPAARDSVASWTLTGAGRSRWVLCDYPPDIEAVLGPPSLGRDGRPPSVRNLPTGWAESMVVALAAVCRDG